MASSTASASSGEQKHASLQIAALCTISTVHNDANKESLKNVIQQQKHVFVSRRSIKAIC